MKRIVQNISLLLTVILFIKIGGYFSIVEDRGVNQVFKILSRFGMTLLIVSIYYRFKSKGCNRSIVLSRPLPAAIYVLYLLLGFASIMWSTDPKYSALQLSMVFDSFIFVFFFFKVSLVSQEYFKQKIDFVRVFVNAIFPIMLIFVVGSVIEPDTFYRGMRGGEEKRLGGWIMNPNELGMLASIACSGSVILLMRKKKWFANVIFIGLALTVLLLTSSRSSAIGFVAVTTAIILKSENKKLKLYMIGIGSVLAPLLIAQVVFKDSGGLDEVMSMTGRLPFWKALLNEGIVKEPFLGFGFMRINYTDYFQGLNTYPGKMTHNTFLQVLMNLGFVGLTIALLQLITTIRSSLLAIDKEKSIFFIMLFIPIIINSFTEFGIFGESNYAILFYQFLIFLFTLNFSPLRTAKDEISKTLVGRNFNIS